MSFAQILEKLPEPADRESLQALAAKYPQLQSELDEVDSLRTSLAAGKQQIDQVSAWARDNWVHDANHPQGGYTKAEKLLKEQLAAQSQLLTARQAEIETLRALSNGEEMTFEELSKQLPNELERLGYVRKESLDPLQQTVTQLSEQAKGIENTFLSLDNGFTTALDVATRASYQFQKEFDKPFGMREFLDHARRNGFAENLGNPETYQKAYDSFVQPMRSSINEAKLKQEAEERYQQGLKEGAANASMREHTPGMPVDTGGTGGAPVSGLQAMQMRRAGIENAGGEGQKTQLPASVKVGDGLLARNWASTH